jgi:16S rRNA G966 N2-methylase RsmD
MHGKLDIVVGSGMKSCALWKNTAVDIYDMLEARPMKLKNIILTYKAAGMKGIFHAILEKASEYWYEKRFDLDCRDRIEIEELNESVNDERYGKYGVVFASTAFEWMQKGIESLPVDIEKMTLLDLGSGKGRMLCYALQKGFRKVIGVEWAPELALISRRNLEKLTNSKVYRGEHNWEIINGDASEFNIPKEVDVIWMFNPFNGTVLEKALHNIKTLGQCKQLYVIFANPPKEEITSTYITVVNKIRPNYPKLFLYKTFEIPTDGK